ncbi:MAG: hypothetical protein LBU77_01330 [Clostridiales bacterium]|nr:hypothetical protein [Clostridiales bacterium]
MLTNLFYYDYYKPYILKGASRSENAAPFSKAEPPGKPRKDAVIDGNHTYTLNTARKSEVIDYMRGLSSGITDLKESAKHLTDSIARYQNTRRRRGGDAASEKEWLGNSLKAFASSYNTTYAFAAEHPYNAELPQFAEKIKQSLLTQSGGKAAFLSLDGDEALVFDEERFEKLGLDEMQKELAWIYPAVGKVQEQTVAFLAEPLATHMAFKELDFYYNYQYAGPGDNAFKLVDRGLLLDLVI